MKIQTNKQIYPLLKKESEGVKIEETFRVKHEDTEEQIGQMPRKEESRELTGMESEEGLEKHGDKPYTCEECGKTFGQKRILTQHSRVHSGEKPFACQQCGKSFASKGNLVAHMKIHSGERPYACPECGKRFLSNSNLKKHGRSHTREKPYTCELCGNGFTENGSLKKHVMRIHAEKRSFVCPQCGTAFASKVCFNTHMKTHLRSRFYMSLAWKEFLGQEKS
ncbi:gastrula zinc finger protein XlCGF49.1-like [Puntigrus tetrazona]|uniref:gastrula zinc finger protein XlCGF49.1-like n=1 Tax=Puntigrus tetrazona TaxID=1606681 RepID=UPI001C891874|nr:gastrula zinc finger protein XlCGF49.1-like [Puntigrus tetrazona]